MIRKSVIMSAVCALFWVNAPSFADEARQTYTDAMGWYLKAAKAGEARAQFLLAMQYELGVRGKPNPEKALHWYRQSAKGGYAQAQYKMGLLLSKEKTPENLKQAVEWFRAAAEAGIAEAAFNYALLCEQGLGTEQNLPEAAKWYEAAAKPGLSKAAMNLAVLHSRGIESAKPNRMMALAWLRIAETLGEEIPDPVATLFRVNLPDDDVAEAKAYAETWLAKR